MTAWVMDSVAWLVILAACAWVVQWLCRSELRELKADHDSELAAMATRHKAEVLSMEEAHREELRYWELRESQLQETIIDLRAEVGDMRDRVRFVLAKAQVLHEVVESMEVEAGQ